MIPKTVKDDIKQFQDNGPNEYRYETFNVVPPNKIQQKIQRTVCYSQVDFSPQIQD